jgi:serine/threonine-protein kinase
LIGEIIASRYRIEARLGDGAMGAVYRARHVKLGRPFAVKVLRPALLGDETIRQRFRREAKLAGSLDHHNIVGMVDIGETSDGLCYLVMEYAPGATLYDLILQSAPLPTEQVIAIMRQLCDGLAHAHDRGLIHRDFKPENVVLERSERGERLKIIDFGIAILRDEAMSSSPERLTTTGIVLGTPHYMAPEQALGDPLDHRVDLFALGVMCFEMLTGRPPFDGDGVDVARANVALDTPAMSERAPGLTFDPLLEALTRRLMSKSREARPESAAATRLLVDLIVRDRAAAAAALDTTLPARRPAGPRIATAAPATPPPIGHATTDLEVPVAGGGAGAGGTVHGHASGLIASAVVRPARAASDPPVRAAGTISARQVIVEEVTPMHRPLRGFAPAAKAPLHVTGEITAPIAAPAVHAAAVDIAMRPLHLPVGPIAMPPLHAAAHLVPMHGQAPALPVAMPDMHVTSGPIPMHVTSGPIAMSPAHAVSVPIPMPPVHGAPSPLAIHPMPGGAGHGAMPRARAPQGTIAPEVGPRPRAEKTIVTGSRRARRSMIILLAIAPIAAFLVAAALVLAVRRPAPTASEPLVHHPQIPSAAQPQTPAPTLGPQPQGSSPADAVAAAPPGAAAPHAGPAAAPPRAPIPRSVARTTHRISSAPRDLPAGEPTAVPAATAPTADASPAATTASNVAELYKGVGAELRALDQHLRASGTGDLWRRYLLIRIAEVLGDRAKRDETNAVLLELRAQIAKRTDAGCDTAGSNAAQ